MGCTSQKQTKEDEDEIKNYDERDNFYSFHAKKRQSKKQELDINENESENKEKNEDKDSSSSNNNKNEEDINKTSKQKNKDSNNNKNGDLYRDNSENQQEDNSNNLNNNDNKNSSKKNSNSQWSGSENNKKIKDNIKDIKDKENSNPFKESSDEMEYYSKKLKSKNKGIEFDKYHSKAKEIMYDYKNMFSEAGEKIPEYKVYAKNEDNTEKETFYKKSKMNGIVIVENLKEYFPKEITRDEVQELIFEAFGDCIVEDDDLLIPGQTATYDQVLELSDYIFNYIKGNDKKMKNNKSLEKLNIKIDLVSLDKKFIKDKLFKGKEPSEKELEKAVKSYSGSSKDVKALTIEFL
jgi:hypothetical protein